MQRLFGCAVTLTYTSDGGEQFVNALIADRGEYWWDVKQPAARALWESRIVLGARFFQEIITNPVPIDLHVLRAVKRSSLGLDLYLWLTYRTFTLTRPLPLKWSTLYEQLGADPARSGAPARPVDSFRTKCLRELKKINTAWPTLNYRTVPGGLVLKPSRPRIAPVQFQLRG